MPANPTSYTAIFRSYWSIMKKYPVSGLGFLMAYGIGWAFSEVIVQLFYRDLFDLIAPNIRSPEIWQKAIWILASIGLIHLIFIILFRLGDYLIVYHQSNVMRELNNQAFEKLQKHSYRFFANSFTGSLVAKVKRYVSSFMKIQDEMTFQIWMNIVTMIGVFISLFLILRPLAIFVLIWGVVYISATYKFVLYRKKYDLREAAEDSKVTARLADVVTNIVNLKLFHSHEKENRSFHDCTQNEHKARSIAWNINNIYYAMTGFMMSILEIVGMGIVVYFWFQGKVSAGTVILVQLYFLNISKRLFHIGRALGDIFKGFSDASEMVEILSKPIEVKDAKKPEVNRIKKGAIHFKKLTFKYKESETVFKNFDLKIPAGQKVGVVGHSGAGKSSLFRLILRFMDIQKGEIKIDGQNIKKITQNDLRKSISFVPQDPILFHRSLFENIAYSKTDATKEEVIQAAKWAHAHEFIQNLPKKYQTLVGERGIKLSGGERQRIAIARAFLKKAPILLLDEATSSLDSISEKYIQENLIKLMEGKTTLAIAHRISTIQQMDRILVIEEGDIVEEGTHEELLKKKGVYNDLWSHQSNGFLLDD